METFDIPADKYDYDAAGNRVKADTYDPEAQEISNEFKRPPY